MPPLDDQCAWLALAESALGARWWRGAVAAAGSAAALLECSDARLGELGLTGMGIAMLRARSRPDLLAGIREHCGRLAIQIAPFADPAYPPLLREIPDPPAVLYFRGPPPASLPPMVAVVGSRRATRYGRRAAHRIAGELARAGVVVVSGLAHGIDTCAHEGALDDGKSAAVLACGLDQPYPRSNRRLFEAIVASGGVTSEHPPETPPLPFRFPARNRIVTGMSRAVVIVESAARSGSLVSARLALEQGRELFAVPGNLDSPLSCGTNALLRDGCAPLVDVGDVLAAIGVERTILLPSRTEPHAPQERDARAVLAALESEPAHIDAIVDACGLDGARVLELLTSLELAGLAERTAGGLFALSERAVFPREPRRPRRTA